jgi:two-component system sensor histidine kinase/response regulator
LNMPGMNGFEVCKRIRSGVGKNDVPVIFLSAESERESILKGFEVGAQDYVTKPFDTRELLARVRTQLELKSKTENLEKINEWLGKKIEKWLKISLTRPEPDASNDLGAKMMEFDKNQSFILKDICLELRTSVNEVEKFIGKNKDSNFKEIIKKMEDAVTKLEKL